METLDISRLIEVAQDMIHDGKIEMSEQATGKVQDIQIGDKVYSIELVIKLNN
jgi:ribosomal 50S subunit-recycling heat shock protein